VNLGADLNAPGLDTGPSFFENDVGIPRCSSSNRVNIALAGDIYVSDQARWDVWRAASSLAQQPKQSLLVCQVRRARGVPVLRKA
jgi:hypothetical protein